MASKFLDIDVLTYAIKNLTKQIDKVFLKKSVLFDVQNAYYRMFDATTDDISKKLVVVSNDTTPTTGQIKSDDVRAVTKTPVSVYAVGSEIIYIDEVLTPKFDNVLGISEVDLTAIKNDTTENRQNNYKSNILFVVDDTNLVFYDRDLDTFTDCTSNNTSTPNWIPNHDYVIDNYVKYNNQIYKCVKDHTSSTNFEDDDANWISVLTEYYVLTKTQHDQLVADGIITDETKNLYIVIDGDDDTQNGSYIEIVDTLPTPSADILDCVYFDKTNNHIYRCIEDVDNPDTYIMKDINIASDGTLGYDFTSNIVVGAYPKGTQFTSDMLLKDVVRGAFITHIVPTITFTMTSPKVLEYGETITDNTLTAKIVKESSSIESVVLTANDVELVNDTTTYANGGTVTFDYSSTEIDEDVTFKCIVNDGTQVTTKTLDVKYQRFYFIGSSVDSNLDLTTSQGIRDSLTKTTPVTVGKEIVLNIPSGARTIGIAVPNTLTLDKVIYVEGLNSDVKGSFTLTNVNVEGANGYTGIDYNVYTYVAGVSFPNNATYKITLK